MRKIHQVREKEALVTLLMKIGELVLRDPEPQLSQLRSLQWSRQSRQGFSKENQKNSFSSRAKGRTLARPKLLQTYMCTEVTVDVRYIYL